MAPDDPHISDTLGCILYQRGVHHWGLSLLRESTARFPDSLEVMSYLITWGEGTLKTDPHRLLSP